MKPFLTTAFLLGIITGLLYANHRLTERVIIAECNLESRQVVDRSLPAVGIRGDYFKKARRMK